MTIPLSDLDLWHECTDAERRDWEEQHPSGDVPEPEPSDDPAEPANVPADPANEGKEAEV